MPRPDFLDDWIEANGIEKPVHKAVEFGAVSFNDAENGPMVGLLIRYTDQAGKNPVEVRFHLPADYARSLGVELVRRSELAKSGKPGRPLKPN